MRNWIRLLLLTAVLALLPETVQAYEIRIKPEESKAIRFVPASARDYAVTFLGQRIVLATRRGDSFYCTSSGWARGRIRGDAVVLRTKGIGDSPVTLTFRSGILTSLRRKGGTDEQRKQDEALVRMGLGGKSLLSQLWSETPTLQSRGWDYWTHQKGFNRLRLWFFNPNGAGTFFAELAFVCLCLGLFVRWRVVRVVGFLLAAAFLFCELKTGSRGALVALFAGVMALGAARFRQGITKRRLLIVGLVVIAVVALLLSGAFGARMGRRLLAFDWSNLERLRIWREVPWMMAAAPGGWGLGQSGTAFCDWFQRMWTDHPLIWLVNSHLTWMVELGRWFSIGYVFVWLAAFAAALRSAWRGSRVGAAALGVFTLFFVALWFSTVGVFVSLWIVPAVALSLLAVARVRVSGVGEPVFDAARCRVYVALAVVAALIVFGTESVGRCLRGATDRAVPVRCESGRVIVGRGKPSAFLVTDDETLSARKPGELGRAVRSYCHPPKGKRRRLPTFAIVPAVADVPDGVQRLVLAGRAGEEFRNLLDEGTAPKVGELVFLSPPFAPTVLPSDVAETGKVRFVYGTFSLRLDDALAESASLAETVPGAELYLPDWPAYLKGEER